MVADVHLSAIYRLIYGDRYKALWPEDFSSSSGIAPNICTDLHLRSMQKSSAVNCTMPVINTACLIFHLLTLITGSRLDWDMSLSFTWLYELYLRQKQSKRVTALGAGTVPVSELPAVWASPSGLQNGIWLVSIGPKFWYRRQGLIYVCPLLTRCIPVGHMKERALSVTQASLCVPKPSTRTTTWFK